MYNDLLKNITEKLMLDGFWDKPEYQEIINKYGPRGPRMSRREKEEIDFILNTPDARPGEFDRTLEAWLFRISLWGKITITHKNPDTRTKRKVSQQAFLNYINDDGKERAYGKFHVRTDKVNRIVLYRTFYGIRGKPVTEEFIVDIKLRPDLKKLLAKARREMGLFGQFI